MTPADAKKLWDDCVARGRALDACSRHVFVDATPERTLNKKWRCTACGGEIGTTERRMYDQGLAHGLAAAGAS